MLRIVFLGAGGALSCRSLEALAARHHVAAVVLGEARPPAMAQPRAVLRRVLRRMRRGPADMETIARRLGVPFLTARRRDDPGLAKRLRAQPPDLMCIAGYPWVISPDLYRTPRLGAVNLHTSLLPRHRGVMPLFWLYQDDDREAGVTVHWVTERADAGDILAQQAFPLDRGCPIVRVHERCAELGAQALAGALDAIERGDAVSRQQDETLATPAPLVRPGASVVQFDAWDVERVWHVLAGLYPLFRQPLSGAASRPIRYAGVLDFERTTHSRSPGDVERSDAAWVLFCRGGVVRLAPERQTDA